jgi:hypothetical protein
MEALPVRPQGPHHPPHRYAHRTAHRGAVAGAAAAAGATPHAARPAHAAAAQATPGDLAALAEQATFDAMASARAEQQREMNALRDLAMQQVKRDDQVMNEWIKLI